MPTVSKILWAVIWKTMFDTVQSCTDPVREVRWPWGFYFDFIQRVLFLSSGGLTSTLLAPVGLRCLFLSLVSVPLQHESCNWTSPPEALRKHILPALSSASPPAVTSRGGNALSCLICHQSMWTLCLAISIKMYFWCVCVCVSVINSFLTTLSDSVCFHTHTHRVA